MLCPQRQKSASIPKIVSSFFKVSVISFFINYELYLRQSNGIKLKS